MKEAKQFYNDAIANNNGNILSKEQILDLMLYFARCHVGMALKCASSHAKLLVSAEGEEPDEHYRDEIQCGHQIITVSEHSISFCYPPHKIK